MDCSDGVEELRLKDSRNNLEYKIHTYFSNHLLSILDKKVMNDYYKILTYNLLSATIISCNKKIEFDSYSEDIKNIPIKLKDPNSISNMKLALAMFQNTEIENIHITSNKLHVKFSPATWDEYDSLTLKNRDLLFFNYPLNTIDDTQSQDIEIYSDTPNDI